MASCPFQYQKEQHGGRKFDLSCGDELAGSWAAAGACAVLDFLPALSSLSGLGASSLSLEGAGFSVGAEETMASSVADVWGSTCLWGAWGAAAAGGSCGGEEPAARESVAVAAAPDGGWAGATETLVKRPRSNCSWVKNENRSRCEA